MNTFSIPQFNLLGMSWDDLVFERKLKADQAIIFNPHIKYTVSKNRQEKQTIFQWLGVVNEYTNLQQIDILDGDIDLRLKNDVHIRLDNATLSVQSQSLLESKKISNIKSSLDRIRFENGIIHAGNIDIKLRDISYIGKSGQFAAGRIDVSNSNQSTAINLQQVSVRKMQVDERSGNLDAEGIRWKNGTVKLNTTAPKTGAPPSQFKLRDVNGTNTVFNGLVNGKMITTNLSNLSFEELDKREGETIEISKLIAQGKDLRISDEKSTLQIEKYDFRDRLQSSFDNISYNAHETGQSTEVLIPKASLITYLDGLMKGNISIVNVAIDKPLVNITQEENTNNSSLAKINSFYISSLRINQPRISYKKITEKGTVTLEWRGDQFKGNNLSVEEAVLTGGDIRLTDLRCGLSGFTVVTPTGKSFKTGEGAIGADFDLINIKNTPGEPTEWDASLVSLQTQNIRLDSFGKKKGNLFLKSAFLRGIMINSSNILNIPRFAEVNRMSSLTDFTGSYADSSAKWNWGNVSYYGHRNIFSADSFSMSPALSKDSFIARQQYQNDYFTIRSGPITAEMIDMDSYVKKKILTIKSISVSNLLFTDYKDRQLPFNPGIVKPLAVNMLKKINQKFSIDTLSLQNSRVEYTEVSDKTKLATTIPVGRLNVRLANIKNYNFLPTDSLHLVATGYALDTAWVRLRVKESYTDTLGGFLMTIEAKPLDLTLFNATLAPLASINIQSGFMDTLSMRAVGREYLSWGEMKLFYHDLKVKILSKGEENKKTFLTRILNFVANTFVIKSNNTSRTGNVFFIRQRDRSAINYIIKIAFSGVTSSIGATNNKKLLRRYKKELDKKKLPPIEL